MCLGDQLDLSEDTTTVGRKKQRLSCWEASFYLSCFYLPSCCWNKSTVEFICLSFRNPRIKSIWNWSSETNWYTKALWQSKVSSANWQVGQIHVMFHRVTVYQWISVLILYRNQRRCFVPARIVLPFKNWPNCCRNSLWLQRLCPLVQ